MERHINTCSCQLSTNKLDIWESALARVSCGATTLQGDSHTSSQGSRAPQPPQWQPWPLQDWAPQSLLSRPPAHSGGNAPHLGTWSMCGSRSPRNGLLPFTSSCPRFLREGAILLPLFSSCRDRNFHVILQTLCNFTQMIPRQPSCHSVSHCHLT